MKGKINIVFLLYLSFIFALDLATADEAQTFVLNDKTLKVLHEKGSCCGMFKNFTLQDWSTFYNEILNWKPPKEIIESFPYYHAGSDKDGRQLWVIEAGKYNIRKVVKQGTEATNNLERYFIQLVINALKSLTPDDKGINESDGADIILDFEGFDVTQFSHGPSLLFILHEFRTYSRLLDIGIHRVYVINIGFPSDIIKNLGADIFGPLISKVEIYGSKKKWLPVLSKAYPELALPSWYGGSMDFKPVKVYG